MMSRAANAALASLFLAAAGVTPLRAQDRARRLGEGMLAAYDPALMRDAETRGLWDRSRLSVLRETNPFFLRGDFDGDGRLDVAFWVKDAETERRGVAIVHASLDTLYVFGAGRPGPAPDGALPGGLAVDAWHVRPAGDVETHPYGDLPEIGVREGEPFTFARDALELVFLGKAAFVFYWADGRYWLFWTAD